MEAPKRQGRPVSLLTTVLSLCLILTAVSCAHGRHFEPAASVPSIWPTGPEARQITSGFGYRKDPINGRSAFHAGIDIAGPKKSRIVATAPGSVLYAARDDSGYGKQVLIDHGNGFKTRYAHLARIKTKKGKHVKQGQVIGLLGKTGRATGFHLQYEVFKDGKPVDPRLYMNGR